MPSHAPEEFNQPLALRIMKTLIYFKARGIRLTRVDIGRLLIGVKQKGGATDSGEDALFAPAQFGEVVHTLNRLETLGAVAVMRGFYEWQGGKRLPDGQEKEERQRQGRNVDQKLKRAQRTVRLVRSIPFVRLLGICGTVATGNCQPESDIDFFVMAQSRRIWTTRFFLMAVLEAIGMRKKPGIARDRICLNHFIANSDPEVMHKDLYAALEFAKMIVLFERSGEWERFFRSNKWIKKYFPELGLTGVAAPVPDEERRISGRIQKYAEWILAGKIGDALEYVLRTFQERRIRKKREQEIGGQVYWGDDALIFHPKPKSVLFADRYREILERDQDAIKRILKESSAYA